MQNQKSHDHYVHLKYHFAAHICRFVAAKHIWFRDWSDLERTVMRILEGAAMLAAMIGAQALVVGTIFIR
ncbi:MAG TPA: hypothetical protein VGC10_08915 [Sphingomonas sp.]